MKKALKFIVPVLGNASLMFADGNSSCPQECPKPKQECKTTCKEVCNPCPTKKICKTTCVEVRQKPPCECVTRACDCGVDFFINADFTWWKPRQDGMEYAVTQPGTGSTSQGRVYHSKENYKPGFKVGVGMDFCDWGWDLALNYTWFRSENRHNTSSLGSAGAGLVLQDAYWFAANNTNPGTRQYTSASSNWTMHWNILDVELGRKYWIGKHIMLRPHAGFKGVWNKQRLQNSYNVETVGGVPGVGGSAFMSQNLKDDGAGIRTGMDTAWHFSRGFSFIGNFALTGLWREFKVTRTDTAVTAGGVVTTPVNVRDRFYTVAPVLEWMFGVKWETWSCGDNYHFAIRAAWEEQVWFDQNRFIRTPGSARNGDSALNIQGLTLGAMFEF